ENRHVRHRMFAIVDRTNLTIASCVAFLDQVAAAPLPQTVAVSALSGTLVPLAGSPIPWRIEPGSRLVVDVGTNQECVEVSEVDRRTVPPTITAVFSRSHAAGAAISLPNVPGPPPVFLKPMSVRRPDPLLPFLDVQVGLDPRRRNPSALAGQYDGIPWSIGPGTPLFIDVGADQEVVVVQAVSVDT